MYFRKLEIFGFKSFPEKVKIIFEPGITAIVGPNGSGKTNIADAIRWILGEQSPRMLRGNQMEDIIFSGTENRKPLGLAEAFLTLDNSQGIFPIQFSELSVGRRLFRSGESEYYINKNLCRLKDIEELFMDTGLGKKAYSLIDQEKMDLILSSSPEERRILFEEAAGIMKYKVKKEESLRKLERTEQNLVRLGDIIAEVDRQLNSISRHFQKARRYKKYKEELDDLEIRLGKNRWRELESILKKKDKENIQVQEKKAELAKKIGQIEAKLEKLRPALAEIDIHLNKKETQNIVKKKEVEGLREKIQDSECYLNEIKEDEENKVVQLEFLSQKEKERGQELADANEKLKDLALEEKEKEKDLSLLEEEASQKSKEGEGLKEELSEMKLEIFDLVRASSQIKNKLGLLAARLNKDLEDSFLNIYARKTEVSSSLKLKEEELKRLKGSERLEDYFHKTQGKVGQIFKVRPEYRLAIEAALSVYLSTLVVEDFSSAKRGLGIIKKEKMGRGEFIVLEQLSEKTEIKIPDSISANPKVTGKASDLIDCQTKHRPLFNYLLGRVLVVEDFDSAEEISTLLTSPWQIVALTGELIKIPGFVSGGSPPEILKIISRENELKKIENELGSLKRNLKAIEDEEKERKEEISQRLEGEKDKLLGELEIKEESIKKVESQLRNKELEYEGKKSELESIRGNIVNLKAELKIIKEKETSFFFMTSHLEGTSEESVSSISRWEEDLEKRKERKEALKKNIKNLKGKIDLQLKETEELDKEIIGFRGEKGKLVNILNENEAFYKALVKEEGLSREESHSLDVDIATIEAEAKNLVERFRDTYGFSLPEEKTEESVENIDELKSRVDFLKERLQSMGPVNLVAIDEHKELEERSHFLKSQSEDLKKSKESLLKAIQEINQTTRALFMETFSQIQRYFSEIFRILFGGGDARLILQDEGDILTSGIEIVASPAGKKLQNISLFSGGEKALTTVALLFALFKVKPSPFCLLDEIDAALDEANVHRFGSLLKDFANKTQFIVITHNKETIASSDIIYGITMEEAGISKIVSVKLTQGKPEPSLTSEAVPSA